MNKLNNFYFQRSNGKYIKLAENITEKEAMKIMQDYLHKHNYKSYYTRMWKTQFGNKYDVGSWSEFFIWGTVPANKIEGDIT